MIRGPLRPQAATGAPSAPSVDAGATETLHAPVAVDRDGQTLREVLLNRLRWEYGDDAPWEELGSLRRLERDVRRWFSDLEEDPRVRVTPRERTDR